MNASWKIDELARRVLQAAQWPSTPSPPLYKDANENGDNDDNASPTPYLDELERALEIRLPPLLATPNNFGHQGASSSGVRTCTVPTGGGMEKTKTEGTNDGGSGSSNGNNHVWTWTPQTNTTTNAYSKALLDEDDGDDDDAGRILEDMAPFSPEFYRAVGELAREAFHPGSVRHLKVEVDKTKTNLNTNGTSASNPDGTSTTTRSHVTHGGDTLTMSTYKALHSLEQYSLPRMMDAVRITRILLSMQELDVGGYNSNSEQEEGSLSLSFMEYLLHYCEGMSMQAHDDREQGKKLPHENSTASSGSNGQHNANVKAVKANKGKRIPILSALFHHWGNLPRLEHGLQQLSRKYGALLPMTSGQYGDYCEYSSQVGSSSGFHSGNSNNSNNNNNNNCSVGDGGSTGGEWKPSSSSTTTSFLGDRALRIDAFKMRIEQELDHHINGCGSVGGNNKIKLSRQAGAPTTHNDGGLIELLTVFYQSSDATLRGKCRRWMGQWLRSFALGSGSSTVSYSTLRRGAGDNGGGGGGGSDASSSSSNGDNNGLGPSFASFCPLVVASSLAMTMTTPIGVGGAGSGPISITHMGGGGGGGGMMPSHHNPLGMENTSASGVEALLHVLLRIIMGFRTLDSSSGSSSTMDRDTSGQLSNNILRPSHEHLLFDVILPLHRPDGLVLWRDQTPLIGLYHESLVKSIGAFLSMDRTLVGPIIGALLHPEIWPGSEGGNTPKVVLLLHEVDTLIGLLLKSTDTDEQIDKIFLASLDAYLLPLVSRLCTCISSENSRTSERSLQFFRNKTFQRLVQRRLDEVGFLFIRALCRCPTREVPWNPTVRKMTLLVLNELEGYYKAVDGPDLFGKACEEAFSGVDISNVSSGPNDKVIKRSKGTVTVDTHSGDSPTISGNMTSLRGAMGSWKPPPQKARTMPSRGKQPGKQPPLTVTGVAPWAMGGQSHGSRPSSKGSGQKKSLLPGRGAAPWAAKKPHGLPSITSRKSSTSNALPRPSKKHISGSLGQPLPKIPAGSVEGCIAEGDDKHEVHGQHDDDKDKKTALDEVQSYMEKLKPKGDGENSKDGISSWAKAQMEESPVLFPNLKFHDLVFGQDLGTGAFSTVKYARRIVKTQTRSNWPEYAVKVVSTQKIEELGYEQSINREIAILRTLSHPSISRLVSSFRFRDGAYLILEYASGGDLHTLLRKNGSLDHESTRFVIGSVAAALWSIHELGFVYADCKPENILITETGHIKVADFGGCRPVTQEAKTLVKESGKNLLKQLRDGDWKTNDTELLSSDSSLAGESLENDEDLRIEGTTAYLPPEVVIGGFPTTAGDVWALGCVLFQCISGRPPILEDTDDLTAQKIVTFDLNSDKHNFFGDCGASTFRDDAKSLIQRMLHRDVACRPDIFLIADDDFFAGMDIFSLHKGPAHPLDVGSIAPSASDSKWTRRQFSSIWAPQPRAYNIGAASNHSPKAGNSRNEPITEGGEADEEFLPRQKAPLLTDIRE